MLNPALIHPTMMKIDVYEQKTEKDAVFFLGTIERSTFPIEKDKLFIGFSESVNGKIYVVSVIVLGDLYIMGQASLRRAILVKREQS